MIFNYNLFSLNIKLKIIKVIIQNIMYRQTLLWYNIYKDIHNNKT